MIYIICDICSQKPSDDFLLEGTIFETKTPFDSEMIAGPKRLTKRPIHICNVCYDKFLAKHLNNKNEK